MNMPPELSEMFLSIENIDMMNFANILIETIPPYFYKVPASSTGKYHPQYALGEGGLLRHTCALVRIMNHTFAVKCMNKWTSRERDCLRIAGIMHDSRKSGSQEEYENNKYTKHDHPLLAAQVVRSYKGCEIIEDDEIELIANAIEAHMGAFVSSKYSDVILPEPKNKYQKMLHWCDYLASRKDIEVKFDSTIKSEKPDIKTYKITFGKHSGQTLLEIKENDPSYIDWLKTQDVKPPVCDLLKEI